jgi:hypothetical protein
MSLLRKSNSGYDLDTPLFYFNDDKTYPWTLRDATMGTQIFGATGSGKSSGSGKTIAKAFLKNGFGGVVLCAKPDEREQWENYAKMTNRTGDLIIFNEQSSYSFNPLLYENKRKGRGGGETLNLVELIMRLYEIGQNFMSGGGGKGEERYWENALRRFVSRAIDLLKMAQEDITVKNLRELLVDGCKEIALGEYNVLAFDLRHGNLSPEEKQERLAEINDLISSNYFLTQLNKADNLRRAKRIPEEEFQFVRQYFLNELFNQSDKVKSILIESFLGLVEPFMGGILKKHFSSFVSPELLPEMTYQQGKIIILDFSVKEFLVSGVYGQGIYKYVWQQAMERRDTKQNDRPVFLWADESQYFVDPKYDTLFQTTARSARVCTVYLTQNINNYYFMMGASNGQSRAKSLVGNLATKVFHANSDFDTNNFAANTIAKRGKIKVTKNFGEKAGTTSQSTQYEWQVQPYEFMTLKTGGRDRTVEGIITMTGKSWKDDNFLHCKFIQDKL